MNPPDYYFTIDSESEVEIKIKGSRFIGRSFKCDDADSAEKILAELRKKFYDATHHCFAYRVGLIPKIVFRYSDDGEPNGTAGRPIFDRIEGADLTETLLVVTRYYGGTKLGTGGLAHAYSDTSKQVLEKSGIVEKFITSKIRLFLDFPDYNNVERMLNKYGAIVLKSDFSEKVALLVELRNSLVKSFTEKLVDRTSGRASYELEA